MKEKNQVVPNEVLRKEFLSPVSYTHLPFSGESPTWIRILHWEYRGHAVYDKRLKEGRSMKRINQPYKWKAYRLKSRNSESGIPEDAF